MENLTSDQLDGIITKVQRLLALSKSSNEHEAALAAARAQDLLFRYNLDLTTVEGSVNVKQPYARHRLDLGTGKALEWKRDLIFTLARYNFCRAIALEGTKAMAIVGQRHNYEVVLGMYDYLSATLARLVERAFVEYRLSGGADHHMTYKTSWLAGAVAGIRAQLKAQHETNKAESDATSALVLVKDQELEQAVTDLMGKLSKHQGGNVTSEDGYRSGYQTGKTIGLHRQVKDGSDAKALSA